MLELSRTFTPEAIDLMARAAAMTPDVETLDTIEALAEFLGSHMAENGAVILALASLLAPLLSQAADALRADQVEIFVQHN